MSENTGARGYVGPKHRRETSIRNWSRRHLNLGHSVTFPSVMVKRGLYHWGECVTCGETFKPRAGKKE